MKKIKALLTAAVLCLCGCGTKPETITITNPVELKSTPADMTVYDWIGDEIGDFREITFTESIRMFSESGSGILYYGYDNCPWCERAIPILNRIMLETGITVYYIDVYGPIQPSREEFDTLLEYIDEVLIEDDEGKKGFFVPLVIGVKNGKITGSHVSLVDGFELENEDDQLSDAQKEELKKFYYEIISKTAD